MKKCKIMLVVLLVLATSLTGFILVKRHQAKTALEAYRKELLAKGELLDERTDRRGEGDPQSGQFERIRESLDNLQEFEVLLAGSTLDELEPLKAKLPEIEPAYQELLALLDGKELGLTEYDSAIFAELQFLSSLLAFHLSAEEERQHFTGVIRDVKAIINVFRGLESGEFGYHYRAMEHLRYVLQAAWRATGHENYTSAELNELQGLLEKLDLLSGIPNRQRMLRADFLESFASTRTSRADFRETFGPPARFFSPSKYKFKTLNAARNSADDLWSDLKAEAGFMTMRERWFLRSWYDIELRILRNMQRHIKLSQDVKNDEPILAAAGNQFPEPRWEFTHDWTLNRVESSTRSANYELNLALETKRRLTITALALERHRRQHGAHPESLNDLIPSFLEGDLVDPWTGEDFRYALRPDGTFLLYSVGANGIDDGGNGNLAFGNSTTFPAPFSSVRLKPLDWVWPEADPSATDHQAENLKAAFWR